MSEVGDHGCTSTKGASQTCQSPNSQVHVPTTVVDTVFIEGVSPIRESEEGRGEPPEVRGGTGTGVSGATTNEPPGFPRPTAITGPSRTK